MKKVRVGTLIFALFLPLFVGLVSSAISSKGMAIYGTMSKPPLSPPAIVFPIAWTILYVMMGLASYFVMISDGNAYDRLIALSLYMIQLFVNFLWSIIFFNLHLYLFAFIWLLALLFLVVSCLFRFYTINKVASYLLIPYAIWLIFAAYLNFGTVILRNALN